jgi:hypothetical protein
MRFFSHKTAALWLKSCIYKDCSYRCLDGLGNVEGRTFGMNKEIGQLARQCDQRPFLQREGDLNEVIARTVRSTAARTPSTS